MTLVPVRRALISVYRKEGLVDFARALDADRSVYRHAVDAVRYMLPRPSVAELAAAVKLARTGPPREEVGGYR